MAEGTNQGERAGAAATVGAAERGEIGGGGGNNEAGMPPFGLPSGAAAQGSEEAQDLGRELAGGGTTGDVTGGTAGGGTVRAVSNGDVTGGSADGGATGELGGLGGDSPPASTTTPPSMGGPAGSDMGGST